MVLFLQQFCHNVTRWYTGGHFDLVRNLAIYLLARFTAYFHWVSNPCAFCETIMYRSVFLFLHGCKATSTIVRKSGRFHRRSISFFCRELHWSIFDTSPEPAQRKVKVGYCCHGIVIELRGLITSTPNTEPQLHAWILNSRHKKMMHDLRFYLAPILRV